MSLQAIQAIADELPTILRNDLIGYTKSVEAALPEIFSQAHVTRSEKLSNELIFIAGIKKIYSICSSQYWLLNNSLHALKDHVQEIRLGSAVISLHSPDYQRLEQINNELFEILSSQGVAEFLDVSSYAEILRRLYRGH